MTTISYRLVESEGESQVAALIDGQLFSATDRHPAFAAIVAGLRDGLNVSHLFDTVAGIRDKFRKLSDRINVGNGNVFFDGEPINDSVADQIIRFLDEGLDDWKPLVNFMEKIMDNPNAHSREQLFDWLSRFDFAITDDGDFIAYKGVRMDGDVPVSITAGPAVVDGEPVNGHVPNKIGSVVEIARSRVVHDPSIGCASGLHAGTWEYASSFGPVTLTVKINPRDVVSVPTDCGWAKIRTSRYEVLDFVNSPIASAYYADEDDWAPDEPRDIHSFV